MVFLSRHGGPVVRGVCCATPEGVEEWHIVATSSAGLGLREALRELDEGYGAFLSARQLGPQTVAFTRFYCADVAREAAQLVQAPLFARARAGAVSIVGQGPLSGGRLALLACHLRPASGALERIPLTRDGGGVPAGVLIRGRSHTFCWLAGLDAREVQGIEPQTAKLYLELEQLLRGQGLRVGRDLIRLWTFLAEIDADYSGMVAAREAFFGRQGLAEATGYPAATGIGGLVAAPGARVAVDALALGGLEPGQVQRLEALDRMPHPRRYGVGFERGLRVRFGDRSHLYLSGTASIDAQGRVLHPGWVAAQTRRTLENLEALLAGQGAGWGEMAYLVLYLRNPADAPQVEEVLRERLPEGLPLLAVQGAVCRPQWLVEIEGLALLRSQEAWAPFF